jgi:hypothetical protein
MNMLRKENCLVQVENIYVVMTMQLSQQHIDIGQGDCGCAFERLNNYGR